MKLRNKKTGEILGSFGSFIIQNPNGINCEAITKYDSLAELNEEWEDYEEPKEYWIIDIDGEVKRYALHSFNSQIIEDIKSIGNYFATREDAEQAVEKLKAWKRIKDKGFRFKTWGWENKDRNTDYCVWFALDNKDDTAKDLDLLFGGEE